MWWSTVLGERNSCSAIAFCTAAVSSVTPSPFNPSTGYGSANFDRRNVFNTSWYYTLPFGKGGKFSFNNSFLDRVVGGWFTSGIWSWQSGFPLCIAADGGSKNSVTSSGVSSGGAGGSGGASLQGDVPPPASTGRAWLPNTMIERFFCL